MTVQITPGATDMKMDRSILSGKSSFRMLVLCFSSKLYWGSYIVSIAKTAVKKIGALIRSMQFLCPEVALYINKSVIVSSKKYCRHDKASFKTVFISY